MVSENLKSWDDYVSGNFLKAVNVDSENDGFVCVDVEEFTDTKTLAKRPRLTLQRNGKEYEFDLNKTNSRFIKTQGIGSPAEIIGCTLFFRKALVRDPTKNIEVEGLRVSKVARIV